VLQSAARYANGSTLLGTSAITWLP